MWCLLPSVCILPLPTSCLCLSLAICVRRIVALLLYIRPCCCMVHSLQASCILHLLSSVLHLLSSVLYRLSCIVVYRLVVVVYRLIVAVYCLVFHTQPCLVVPHSTVSLSCLCRVYVVLLCSDTQGCYEARGGDGTGGTASFQGPFATWRGRKRQDTAGQRDGYRGECHPFLS